MSLTQTLRKKYEPLWEAMVTHPFIVDMGEGTLPVEKFREYFLQDYVFVNDLVSMTAMGIAKAPDFNAASMLNEFLTGILNPENDLFVRAFKELGATEEEYSSASASPTTQAFGDFLVRTGLEGTFEDIVTVLYVTEGTYLDWGTRFINAGKNPSNPVYREWIDLHGPAVLGELVDWAAKHVDNTAVKARTEHIFLTALRYEYLFWEGPYNLTDRWPDQRMQLKPA